MKGNIAGIILAVVGIGIFFIATIFLLMGNGGFPGIGGGKDRVLCDLQISQPITILGSFGINKANCVTVGKCGLFEGSTKVGDGNVEVRINIGNEIAYQKYSLPIALGGLKGIALNVCKQEGISQGFVQVVDRGNVVASQTINIG